MTSLIPSFLPRRGLPHGYRLWAGRTPVQPGLCPDSDKAGLGEAHYLRIWRKGTLEVAFERGLDTIQRIRKKITIAENGCWIFTGRLSPKGYAHVYVNGGGRRFAHVLLYEHENGPIPTGLELDHLCRNRACVNPAHLQPVSHQENMRRAAEHATSYGFGRLTAGERIALAKRDAAARWGRR